MKLGSQPKDSDHESSTICKIERSSQWPQNLQSHARQIERSGQWPQNLQSHARQIERSGQWPQNLQSHARQIERSGQWPQNLQSQPALTLTFLVERRQDQTQSLLSFTSRTNYVTLGA